MGKICEVCGREYERETCPYCKRLERFIRLKQYKVLDTLPQRVREDVKRFKTKHLILDRSQYYFGPVSTGKTIQAAQVYFEQHKQAYMDNRSFSAEFVVVPELLLKIRDCFKSDAEVTERELVDHYSMVDLLVLDELGVDKCSPWVLQTLYLIINRRYEEQKQTIITSNLSLDKLIDWFGDERIPRRIQQTYYIKQFKTIYTGNQN